MDQLARYVINSLSEEPQRWLGDGFSLKRPDGVEVWVANGQAGLSVKDKVSGATWGGLTFRSAFGLSPTHWRLWRAVREWQRQSLEGRRPA